jgi:DNA-directed RNA polymerase specialized sigma24 family protein
MTGRGSPVIVDLNRTLSELAPRVLRYLVARLGDASLGEEIAQESLTALVRCCRNGGAPESAEAFVFAVALASSVSGNPPAPARARSGS